MTQKDDLLGVIAEIYREHKRFILVYLAVAIFVSMSVALGVAPERNRYTFDTNATYDSKTQNTVNASDVVTDGQAETIGGKSYSTINMIAFTMGNSIEPITVLAIEAVFGIAGYVDPDKFGSLTDGIGFMKSLPVCIIVLVLFVVLKFIRSNAFTRITGLVAEDVENVIGAVLSVAVPVMVFLSYTGIIEGAEYGTSAMLTSSNTVNAGQVVLTAFSTFVTMVVSLVVYVIVRTVLYAFNILVTTFSAIPLSSLTAETIKSICAIVTTLVVRYASGPVFVAICVLFALFFIFCLVMFQYCYRVLKYFKTIYVRPLFGAKHRDIIDRYSFERYVHDIDPSTLEVFIPAFARQPFTKVGQYEKVFLMIAAGVPYICKINPLKKTSELYQIEMTPDKIHFINKNKLCMEIFMFINEDEILHPRRKFLPGKKAMRFIISRDYLEYYDEIWQKLQYVDYKTYMDAMKEKNEFTKFAEKVMNRFVV